VRWVFALAFCIAAGAATWGGATEEHAGLRVTIGYAMATADPEDDENRLGVRYWGVSPPVTLESPRRCDRAEVAVSQRLDFNGTLLAAREQDGLSPIDLTGDGFRFTGSIHGPGDASAGERVHFTAKARCFTGETVSTASTTRTFELPLASCDSGPLRVGEVKGLVSGEDWNHGAVTLQPGDVITPGSDLRVPPGGQVELGNPECNGFRVVLFAGEHGVGSYDRSGRGDSFPAERAVGAGDSHAGGVQVAGQATIWPLDRRCRGCEVAQASSYEVRSAPKRVTVRVTSGAVLVGGPDDEPALRVPAGHQASVVCSAGTCRAGYLRLFQASEPWSTPAEGVLDRLPRSVEGASPPLSVFAPAFSQVDAKSLPAAGGEPEQVVVAWSRAVRRGDESFSGFTDSPEQGFLAWQRATPKRWELVYEQPLECCPATNIEAGDLTGDGHLDALINESQGSGGCGFTRVLISSEGRLREEFAYVGCDYSMRIEKGAVVLADGVGPCPFEGGAHCSGGARTTIKRWNGTKLVTTRETVTCYEPHLDPARDCEPKQKRNTP
jgi:hypothetical protein